jgi:hypothetical protein
VTITAATTATRLRPLGGAWRDHGAGGGAGALHTGPS